MLLLLLLNRRYNSVRVLVRSTIFFHKSLSSTLLFQFLIFIVCRSFLTSSSHLFLRNVAQEEFSPNYYVIVVTLILILSSLQHTYTPSYLLLLDFTTKILYSYLISLISVTCLLPGLTITTVAEAAPFFCQEMNFYTNIRGFTFVAELN